MSGAQVKNIAASVKDRLLSTARQRKNAPNSNVLKGSHFLVLF
ncbi:MAG: hypothetical protein A4E73_00508 [Syntrophaceae bacterium PtaU1.Bin231]|nr:MAG: hypothetical protein A4E73_00508 [Syntrophaceae bacterium PtaU1.Bin231]